MNDPDDESPPARQLEIEEPADEIFVEEQGEALPELEAIATAVHTQSALPYPPKLSTKRKFLILFMQTWAALWFGGGVLATIATIAGIGNGDPFFVFEGDHTSFEMRGYGIGIGIAVLCFTFAMIQNRLAHRLRDSRRRMNAE